MLGNKMLKIMVVAMLGGILLFVTACGSVNTTMSVSAPIIEKVKVIDENINIDKPYIKIKGNSIKLEGLSDENIQWKINNYIKYELEDELNLKVQNEKYIYDEYNKGDKDYDPKVVEVSTKNTYNKDNVLSIVSHINTIESKTYSYEIMNTYNVDLKTGQNIELEDLFKNDSYLAVIQKHVDDEIAKNLEDYNTSSVKTSLIKDYYLEKDHLVIVFKAGEIASYSKGNRGFRIPIKSFGDDFNTNIKTESFAAIVDKNKLSVDDKYLKSIVNIPVIKYITPYKEDVDSKELQDELNNLFEKEIMKFRDEMYEDAKAAIEESEKSGFKARSEVANVTFDEKYNKGNLLSIYVTYYAYTGGAHGNYWVVPYNVDLASGKILELKDIFKNEVDYKKVINDEINKQIEEIQEQVKADAISRGEKLKDIYLPHEGFKSIRDDQGFYFKDSTIVVYFDLYEIGPYAAGIIEFPIKISDIGDSLKDEYVIK